MATKGWCTGLARAQGVSAAGAGILAVGPVLAHGVRPVERPAVRHSCALAGGLSASSSLQAWGEGWRTSPLYFFRVVKKHASSCWAASCMLLPAQQFLFFFYI